MSIPTEHQITERIGQLSVPSRLGVKNSLEPIQAILECLDHPERKIRTIHIGGTSGKGSTSTLLANILADSGYTVGLFTKPHLSTVRERLVINGDLISPEEIMDLLERVSAPLNVQPTWFELTTAIAFQYFADHHVDLAVIEVGLGGAYDATNVITPELSVLTNVGLDHTDVLGSTVEEIARDKVGIIKPGKPVVSGVTQPSVIEIVEQKCAATGSQLKIIDRDFGMEAVGSSRKGSSFDFWSGEKRLANVSLPILGAHQVLNAGLALAAAFSLDEAGLVVPTGACRMGLQRTEMPGRMEIFGGDPVILLDGAHSPPKMEALTQSLDALFPERKRLVALLAFSRGHDTEATLAHLANHLDAAVLTEFNVDTDYGNKRAQDPAVVAAALASQNPGVAITVEPDPYRAVSLARAMAHPGDVLVITGSIYLVGQVRGLLVS